MVFWFFLNTFAVELFYHKNEAQISLSYYTCGCNAAAAIV